MLRGYVRQLGFVFCFVFIVFETKAFSLDNFKFDLSILNSLPGKKVTLDYVLSESIKYSDGFRQVRSIKYNIDVPEMLSKASMDWNVYFKGNRTSAKEESLSLFNPSKTTVSDFSLGTNTLFETGTLVQLDLAQSYTKAEYETSSSQTASSSSATSAASAAMASSLGLKDKSYYQAKGTISLQQNLWQDFFGYSLRQGKKAGKLQSESLQAGYDDTVEDWVLGVVQTFYGAWLAKVQSGAAEENLKRRERLLNLVQIKLKRGTAEKPDLLQAESALNFFKTKELSAKQLLDDRWGGLVTSLKMGPEWFQVDPALVPIELDDPITSARGLCGNPGDFSKTIPTKTNRVLKYDLALRSAELNYNVADDGLRPQLKLIGSLSSQALDEDKLTGPYSEVSKLDYPTWVVGLQLQMPLSRFAAKAKLREKHAELERSEALLFQERDLLKTNWINTCSLLFKLGESRVLLEKSVTQQKTRFELETERFKYGRIPLMTVIQAGDDVTQAELSLSQNEVEERIAAWRVRKLRSVIKEYVGNL